MLLGHTGVSLLLSGGLCRLPFLPPTLHPAITHQKLMANYFFTDSDGVRRGPLTIDRLQTLAERGIITPETQLETDTGHTGFAGKIPSLKFDAVATSSFAQKAPQMGGAYSETGDIALFDFSFKKVRLPQAIRRACLAMYVCAWSLGILLGLLCLGLLGNTASPGDAFQVFLTLIIPLWLVIIIFIFFVRIFCEWQIVMMDWIIATKNYVENTREQKK